MSFSRYALLPELLSALEKEGILVPTTVQEKAIPALFEKDNLLVQAETGTGKTLAFLLPLLSSIDQNKNQNQVIVLAPTHELAMQTKNTASRLVKNANLPIRVQALIGNVSVRRQLEGLKEKPHLIVGTPGRIADLLVQKKIKGHTIKTIVFDEADVLFHQEKKQTIEALLSTLMKDTRLLFFSATYSDKSLQMMRSFSPELQKVIVAESGVMKNKITHIYYVAQDVRDKFKLLVKVLGRENPSRAMIFIGANTDALMLSRRLAKEGFPALILHGKQQKEERKSALEGFRQARQKLLIASDMAARGLDVPDVSHIYHYHLPENPKVYLHRAGRTGRAGALGTCVSLAGRSELRVLSVFEKELSITFKNGNTGEGLKADMAPRKKAEQAVKSSPDTVDK